MEKTKPFRAEAEDNGSRRDDADRENNTGYSRFAKDKRKRIVRVEKNPKTEGDTKPRQSFNPNFDSDNRLRSGRRDDREQDGDSRDRQGYGDRRDPERQPQRDYPPRRDSGDYRQRNDDRERRTSGGYREGAGRDYHGRGDTKPHDTRDMRDNDRRGPAKGYGRENDHGERKAFGSRSTYNDRRDQEGGYRQKGSYGDKRGSGSGYGRSNYGDKREAGGGYKQNSYGDKRNPTRGYGDKPDRFHGQSAGDRRPQARKNNWNRDSDHTPGAYSDGTYPTFPREKIEDEIRLNRFIAMSGICSRREADELIRDGLVTVNGEVVTELGSKISRDDVVKYNDRVIQGENKVYILMNKPKGYVTTLEDPHADKTVMDLLKDKVTERVYPVGRLDKNSLGVLLITNDGEMTKKLTHPSFSKKKIYHVTLDKPLTKNDMQRLADGVELEDGEIHADEISYVGDSKKEVGIEIHSGRNRIIRRMFDHLGYSVQKLDRVYFAGLTKKNIKRGAWRFLTPHEVDILHSGKYE